MRRAVSSPGAAGYTKVGSVYAPSSYAPAPVPTSKLQIGLKKARNEIAGMIDSLFLEDGSFELAEISFSVSFDAKGEFLGIGIGGTTSMTLTIRPKRQTQ